MPIQFLFIGQPLSWSSLDLKLVCTIHIQHTFSDQLLWTYVKDFSIQIVYVYEYQKSVVKIHRE